VAPDVSEGHVARDREALSQHTGTRKDATVNASGLCLKTATNYILCLRRVNLRVNDVIGSEGRGYSVPTVLMNITGFYYKNNIYLSTMQRVTAPTGHNDT
jgi:hypothetical protein